MGYLLEGIQLGLALAILTGPLLFALLQASLERGVRGGMMVALGIWISDVLFLAGVYSGLNYVEQLVRWDGFETTLGLAGSLILAGFGLAALLSPPPAPEQLMEVTRPGKTWGALLLKGFLINTINPFTVFFWFSVMTGLVRERGLDPAQTAWFIGGLLGTIVATDTTKVLLARQIRRWMQPQHVQWLRRLAGVALLAFGVALLWRVLN